MLADRIEQAGTCESSSFSQEAAPKSGSNRPLQKSIPTTIVRIMGN